MLLSQNGTKNSLLSNLHQPFKALSHSITNLLLATLRLCSEFKKEEQSSGRCYTKKGK